MNFDVKEIRKDFPILSEKVHNKPLVYFDNAATSQKPRIVIDTIAEYYSRFNSNIHRGVHYLSNFATEANERARETVRKFINASSTEEIIFTRGTTESINLVAYSFGETFIGEGDEIIVSEMEHHSDIVPWQLLCDRKKSIIKVLPFDDKGVLKVEKLESLITDRTKIVAVTQISNVLGTVNPIKEVIEIAHKHNIPVLIDGAQGVQHTNVDVQALDCDFYVFSGHKTYGPTGVGVLYGKKSLLEQMVPYQGGGEMIESVSFAKTTYNVLPFKFEAGTPNYIDAIALEKAILYIQNIGIPEIEAYEKQLLDYATEQMSQFDWVRIIGTAPHKASLISFVMDGIHFSDAGILLDQLG
ncbi:MAG: SufS family cysteine desulfurase, partial [Bacteroidales bacterium]|nr:SufS family cysteine desulfurase [Bacteroidales bacterium]